MVYLWWLFVVGGGSDWSDVARALSESQFFG